MQLKVSSPGRDLKDSDIDRIQKDLEKLDRRLEKVDDFYVECRINGTDSAATTYNVILELEYRRNHLRAKAEHTDMGQAVREARDELIRQINDRKRGGHSSFAKRR